MDKMPTTFKEMTKMQQMRVAISGTDGRRMVLIEKTNSVMHNAPMVLDTLNKVKDMMSDLSSGVSDILSGLREMKNEMKTAREQSQKPLNKNESTKPSIIKNLWDKLRF